MDSLFKQFFVFTTVHQDRFCAEHFRNFSQYACASLCNQEIGEHTQQWVGRNAGETVRTTAFQSHTKFGQRYIGTFVFRGFCIQITQDFHSFFIFVAYLLGNHEFDAVFIKFAQEFTEYIRLVILTSQAYYQYSACIGMKHHVTKNLFRILMVVTKLRATVVVWESDNGIHSLTFGFATQSLGQLSDDTVYATYSRDNPYLVSYTYITVFATVTFESKIFMRNIQRNLNRVVRVVQQSGKVGFDVRFVHPVTLFLCHSCMSDRVTVLDYIFTFRKIL